MDALTPEQHEEMEAFCSAAKASFAAQELMEQYRPAIVDHMQRAHDCLGLLIEAYQMGSNVPGAVTYGYGLQFDNNIKAAGRLSGEMLTEAAAILQRGKQ